MNLKTSRIADVIPRGLSSLQLITGIVVTGTVTEVATRNDGAVDAVVVTGAQFHAPDVGTVTKARLVVPLTALAFIMPIA